MDFLSHPIPAVVILLGVLVFVHEFGHFIVGKLCGIAAEVFSIGFGPPILNFKYGLTQYRLSIIPLGGYVKFFGAIRSETVPPEAVGHEFYRAAAWKRLLTIAAGPLFNIFLAVVSYFALAKSGIPYILPQIGYVNAGGTAASAGIEAGDKIVAIDGKSIRTWRDLETQISKSAGIPLNMTVDRNQQMVQITVTPASEKGITETGEGKVGRIGIAAASVTSTIAVRDQGSAAYLAGLRTGDQVKSIQWQTADKTIQTRGIENWISLKRALLEARVGSINGDVTFQVAPQSYPIPAPAPKTEASKAAELKLFDGATSSPMEAILLKNGIFDGQMIIDEPDPSVATVLQPGDVLVAINGNHLSSQFDAYKVLDTVKSEVVEAEILRNSASIKTSLSLKKYKRDLPERVEDAFTLPAQLAPGLKAPETLFDRHDLGSALRFGITETAEQSVFLVTILRKIFTGHISLSTMGGPILIAKVAGDAAKRGWQTFISTLAIISINLAVVNMVPIPVLDGGQIVLILAETIRRRPVSIAAIENYQRLGFVMVMALVVLVFYNDLNRFWSRMLEGVIGP